MRLSQRILRFALIGSICFGVQLVILLILSITLHMYIADVIAFLLSAQLNFILSQQFTWGDRPLENETTASWPLWVRWLKYNTTALMAGFVVNPFTLQIFVWIGWPIWAALLIATAVTAAFSFTANHFVVFKPPSIPIHPEPEEQPVSASIESVAFFLPAHNEAENLPSVIENIHAFFLSADISDYSVIVIDDGSTDNTAEILEEVRGRHPVHVVTHEVNRGYGSALRSGFTAGLDTGHEWIVFCDSDGQFDPRCLALLLNAAKQGNTKVAIGYRVQRADGLRRRVAGRTWHTLSQLTLKFKARDTDCGFKAIHRDALGAVAHKLHGEHATISPELLARLSHAGYGFVEVPLPHYPRTFGKQSGMKLHVMIGSLIGLLATRREIYTKEVTV